MFIIALIILSITVILVFDYVGPRRVHLRPSNAFGMTCSRAKDLIVQEFDHEGNLWATRGMIIYQQKKGDDVFIRMAHVPSDFSFFWLNNFRFFRKLTLRPECVEMTVAKDGSICAFSSGTMWNSLGAGKKFVKTMKLPYFGIRVGRGIMSPGLIQVNEQEYLFGEYFSNPERISVRIYKYENIDNCWSTVHVFQPGQIRHVHALQRDPYTGKLWICTGDEDKEPMIGWSGDCFKTIVPIGLGNQKWRACQLVFTEEAVLWGADTGNIEMAGIYSWNKVSQELTKLQSIPGAIFYCTRLANGIIIMSTDREGFPNEKDEKTRLAIINRNNEIKTIDCGTWNWKNPGLRFNFAKLRFQRGQGSNLLAISCLNLKEIPDGDMLIFSEDVFN